MPISDYHRSILKTRAVPLKGILSIDERIDSALRSAFLDVQAIIESGTVKGKFQRSVWESRRDGLERRIKEMAVQLNRDITDTTRVTAQQVASIRESATNALLSEVESKLVVSFAGIPDEAMRLFSSRVDVEGLKISPTIWGDTQNKKIAAIVESGLAQGQGANILGVRLRHFILGASGLTDSQMLDLRTLKGDLRNLGVSINYKAKRLARTEIANAAWEAGRLSAEQSPVVNGVKWNLSNRHKLWDSCDLFAEQDLYGLGKGIYPSDKLPPKAHPNCLCYQTDALRKPSEWEQPKSSPKLQKDVDRIRINGQGTDRHIERQSQVFQELVKST